MLVFRTSCPKNYLLQKDLKSFVALFYMVESSYIGFYAAIAQTNLDEVELIIRDYTDQYIITCECSPTTHKATQGWHMHFLINSTEKGYRNVIQKLKLKYNLVGKTTKDNAHGYGRVRGELRDTERYISYMFKDQDPVGYVNPTLFRFGHFALDYLNALQQKSFPKVKPSDVRDEIMMFIGDIQPTITKDPDTGILYSLDHPVSLARERIIQYFIEKTDKAPTRSRVQYLLMHYFVQYNKNVLTNKQICEWFYS